MADNPQQAAKSPPEIITLPPFRVLGVRGYCAPGVGTVQDLWDGPFMERHEALKALSADGRYLGMAWQSDSQGGMFYLAGVILAEDTVVPAQVAQGLYKLRLPASQWARFRFTFGYMQGRAPNWAHHVWLPASAWRRNRAIEPIDLAIYLGDTVEFHIPVVEAQLEARV